MGLHFSIGYTKAKSLNHLNNNTCDASLEQTRQFIIKKISIIKKLKNYNQTDDYKKYGLYPGQQITRLTKGILPHHAIYIYDGIIFETGSGPKSCAKNLGHPLGIREHINGLTTLKNFKYYSKKNGSDIQKIITNKDSNKEEILKKLNRVLYTIGKYNYNWLTNNCLHTINYIAYGKRNLTDISNLNRQKLNKT